MERLNAAVLGDTKKGDFSKNLSLLIFSLCQDSDNHVTEDSTVTGSALLSGVYVTTGLSPKILLCFSHFGTFAPGS